ACTASRSVRLIISATGERHDPDSEMPSARHGRNAYLTKLTGDVPTPSGRKRRRMASGSPANSRPTSGIPHDAGRHSSQQKIRPTIARTPGIFMSALLFALATALPPEAGSSWSNADVRHGYRTTATTH